MLEDKGQRCEDCILAVAADNEDKTSCLQTPKRRNSRRQLLLLKTEIYGLVSGPSWWRRTLLKVATEQLGYAAVDPQPGASSEGFSVIEVDDIAEAGGRACQMHAEVGSYVEV
jgi:hypothetical protein